MAYDATAVAVTAGLAGSLLLGVVSPPAARADDPAPARAPTVTEVAAAAAPRREASHYRGRTREATVEEVLAWIPRVVFAPVSLVTEYVLRRPLVEILSWMERERVLEAVELVLEPHPNVRWTPTLSFEAGVRALPGVAVRWRNFPARDTQLDVAFAMGSDQFWAASVSEQARFGPVTIGARGGASARPERPFFGLGNESGDRRTFYTERRNELFLFARAAHARHVVVELDGGWSLEEAAPGIAPSIEEILPLDQIPGFGKYELAVAYLEVTLDTRDDLFEAGGARLMGDTTLAIDTRDDSRFFMTTQLDLEVGVEVAYPDRVLIARLYAMSTLPFGDEPVPFMHLAWLGWDRHRGFIRGRFRGESALMAELRYRYPINFNVDMVWLASVGNVFARDGSDFDVGALTGSMGVGLRTRRFGEAPLELSFALGTRRFDAPGGFGIQSARFFFETRYGL